MRSGNLILMLSMADGLIRQKAKTPPWKHAIAAYGTAMAGLPSQIAYGSWQKIHHNMANI